MPYVDLLYSVADGVATISFNRKDTGNTLRLETLQEVCGAMDAATADADVRCIVLAAEGRHFSAGADFAFLEELTTTSAVEVRNRIYAWFQGAARRVYRCPKPTLAIVNGAAVTVGCELALACDFRIASEDALFQESWIRLGLMPPLGGLFLLPRIVGLGHAKTMVLRGEAMRAQEALAAGLVSEVVPRDVLAERGAEFAAELAAMAPLAYATVKEALHRGLETGMEAEWSANLPSQAMLIGSEDFREGLDAVRGKRPARFKGR
jgi:enoyl-CoA hydratase/carnithine racemase